MKFCLVTDCPYYDDDTTWKCLKYINIKDCFAIPLINNREYQKSLLRKKIERLENEKL